MSINLQMQQAFAMVMDEPTVPEPSPSRPTGKPTIAQMNFREVLGKENRNGRR
jgi:hypothetical protein